MNISIKKEGATFETPSLYWRNVKECGRDCNLYSPSQLFVALS